MKILKNCRLIHELTEGFDGQYADLVIEDNRIDKISCPGEIQVENDKYIDMHNMTVLPGFFDLHAHLMFMNQDYNASMLRSQNQYVMDCMTYAKNYLRYGYTTIRDCGNDFYAGVAVRGAVESGLIQGARVITSGKIVSPTAVGNNSFGSLYLETDGPQGMLNICRREASQGVDFIKYMITGAMLNNSAEPGALITTPEEIDAIVKAADSLGIYIAAHCHGAEGIKQAVIHGVQTIEHASYINEESIELILKHGNKSAIVPTYSIAYSLINHLYGGAILEEFITKTQSAYNHMCSGHKMAELAGVNVGWGTDFDMENFERNPGLEFIARKQMGLSNIQILRQATINSAKIVGLADQCGTIKVGKLADLVVIDGNPDDDLDVMKKVPAYVFKEGRQFIE